MYGTEILLDASYSLAIDAIPPLRYAEIDSDRAGYLLDDGGRLEFRDRCDSYGDFLIYRHEFERT
jgi:hypothetical protein